jgi:hypothetical protein
MGVGVPELRKERRVRWRFLAVNVPINITNSYAILFARTANSAGGGGSCGDASMMIMGVGQ